MGSYIRNGWRIATFYRVIHDPSNGSCNSLLISNLGNKTLNNKAKQRTDIWSSKAFRKK